MLNGEVVTEVTASRLHQLFNGLHLKGLKSMASLAGVNGGKEEDGGIHIQ